MRYNVAFAGAYDGSVNGRNDYGLNSYCMYTTVRGKEVAEDWRLHEPNVRIDDFVAYRDGPAEGDGPSVNVTIDGVFYLWSPKENLQFEGTEGGTITFSKDGLQTEFRVDAHRAFDPSTRLLIVGTITCPPNPVP